MNRYILFLYASLLVGCSTTSENMTEFERLYEFEGLEKPCSDDKHCKLADRSYVECSGRDVFVYSSLVIRGDNEKHLLALSEKKVEAERKLVQLEECVGGPPPPRGICWRRKCEIIRTWRR